MSLSDEERLELYRKWQERRSKQREAILRESFPVGPRSIGAQEAFDRLVKAGCGRDWLENYLTLPVGSFKRDEDSESRRHEYRTIKSFLHDLEETRDLFDEFRKVAHEPFDMMLADQDFTWVNQWRDGFLSKDLKTAIRLVEPMVKEMRPPRLFSTWGVRDQKRRNPR
jgi:hypothetical protein